MSIVKIYNVKSVKRRLVGYIKVSDFDFDITRKQQRTRKVPNEHFYKKVKNQLETSWSPDLAWKFLSPKEIDQIIKSYEKVSHFYSGQANRLNTLINL